MKFLSLGHLDNNLKLHDLAIFCGSLREVNKDADVLLFGETTASPSIKEIAKKYDISLVLFDRANLSPLYLQQFPVSALMWVFVSNLFHRDQSFPAKVKLLMVANVEEHVFQLDPFELIPLQIQYNKDLMQNIFSSVKTPREAIQSLSTSCFGRNIIGLLQQRPVVDTGLLFGHTHAVLKVMNLLNDVLAGREAMAKGFPRCLMNDPQAAADREDSNRPIPVTTVIFTIMENLGLLQGIVSANSDSSKVLVDMQGPFSESQVERYLQPTGVPISEGAGAGVVQLAAIVTGHRNIPILYNRLARKFVFWETVPDLSVKPTKSTNKSPTKKTIVNINNNNNNGNTVKKAVPNNHCENYSILPGKDIFVARCDLSQESGVSVESCCEQCTSLRQMNSKLGIPGGCTSFAHKDGVCYFKSCTVPEIGIALTAAGLTATDTVQQKQLAAAVPGSSVNDPLVATCGFINS